MMIRTFVHRKMMFCTNDSEATNLPNINSNINDERQNTNQVCIYLCCILIIFMLIFF